MLGPLESFQLRIDDVIDPEERATIKSGKLSGETVVFGLDGTGDRGAFHEAALSRAAEMFAGTPYETAVSNEVDNPGSLALVRFETPGFPSGTAGGSHVPVYIIPVGDCIDITGGHIYPTELRCDRTDEVLLIHPYGSFSADEIVTSEWYFDALDKLKRTDESLFDDHGRLKLDLLQERGVSTSPDAKPNFTLHKYLLLNGFVLARATTWEESGRDEIVMTIGMGNEDYRGRRLGSDEEIMEGVVEALTQSQYSLHVERVKGVANKLLIVPSVRRETIERLYDLIRISTFDIRPKRQATIIIDDNNGRIMIIGPKNYRKLLDSLTFPWPKADWKYAKPSGDFRLIAEPKPDGTLKVHWTRLESGSSVGSGEARISNDIGELLRLIYTSGCSVDDCVYLVIEATQMMKVLNATVNLNPRRIAPTQD